MSGSDSGCDKDKVIEALQECIYDSEQEGRLTDADAFRESLRIVKGLSEEALASFVKKLQEEVDKDEMADSG